ncbi:hypothetical protein [Pseudoalteromonas phenolica]|nr:hypothetical protein [Pseudoalteromonas phenolica]
MDPHNATLFAFLLNSLSTMTPEFAIIAVNFIVLFVAYFYANPKYAGNDFKKISLQDLIASVISLLVVGSVYFGSSQTFTLVFTEVNWVWFTLVSFSVIELPFFLWYAKRYNVELPK